MQDLPLFYTPDIASSNLLPSEESGHALRVLRLSQGDRIHLTDGAGNAWIAVISQIDKKGCSVEIVEQLNWKPYWSGVIILCVAPTKSMDRMEWLLEKATELGVDRVILLRSKHSERKHINAERLRKILIGGMKQSQKALLPELLVDVKYTEALDLTEGSQRLIFHCRGTEEGIRPRVLPHKHYDGIGDVSLFVGPEGDFTVEELLEAEKRGLVGSSLGESRLRTETAALTALQWVHTLQMTRI